jgi:2-polyprenyl-3-methyl-5-hydroxy-6-metoxy-1,4-benzoquinol methylase
MDRLIKRFDAEEDGDLMLCEHRGVAYQRDMTKGRIEYGAAYLANYDAYARGPLADAINAGRVELLKRHAKEGASVLDVGAASGIFVRRAASEGFGAKGFDVIPQAVARLKKDELYASDFSAFDAVTMWDSIEHMDEPEDALKDVRKGAILLASVPIFDDLRRVRESKHHKPGEHLYYWTAQGFVDYMALYGFRLLEQSTHETDAGRESIGAFAFVRDIPDWADHIELYKDMHATRYYGASATELHLRTAANIVRAVKPKSILDYGCGRSDLVAHFWLDGERRIARYDPAIRHARRMPEGAFDLVFVCDVMEHIPMEAVDRVLKQIRDKSESAFFTISTKLARAKLPDGRNSHVTILRHSEWVRWLKEVFRKVEIQPETTEHELVLLAGPRAIALRRAA